MSGLTSEEREVELRWDERDQLARAQHATWHIGCTHECGGRLGDSIKSDEWIAPVVEDILKRRMAPLAARLADAEARAIERLADKLDDLYGDWDDAPITKAALTEWLRAKAQDAQGDS